MRIFSRRLAVSCCAVGVLAGGSLAFSGGGAGAKSSTSTLHFYAKAVLAHLTNAAGQEQTAPAANDIFVSDDLDYVGTHTHHAKNWTASDHEFCSFTSSTSALCFGQFAVGGSLIYADAFTLTSTSSGTVAITGATGKYAGDTGTVSMKGVGTTANSDVTIVLQKG